MTEQNVATAHDQVQEGQNQQQDENTNLFAGKYESPDALVEGFKQLRGKMGLPDLTVPPFGKDGLYADVTGLEAGYKDLESMMGRMGQQQPKDQKAQSTGDGDEPADDLKISEPNADDVDLDQILGRAGLDAKAMGEQWQKDGKLSDDQYAALKKIGYPPKVVDIFMRGTIAEANLAQVTQQQIQQRAATIAGGQEQLKTVLQWAAGSYKPEQIQSLNSQLASPGQYEHALKAILYDYNAASGSTGSRPLISGDNPPTHSAGFNDHRDFIEAVRKARETGNFSDELKAKIAATDHTIIHG